MHDETSMALSGRGNGMRSSRIRACVEVVLVVRGVIEWHVGETRPTHNQGRRGKEGERRVVY